MEMNNVYKRAVPKAVNSSNVFIFHFFAQRQHSKCCNINAQSVTLGSSISVSPSRHGVQLIFDNNTFSGYMKKTYILIALLAAASSPAMAQDDPLAISKDGTYLKIATDGTYTINSVTVEHYEGNNTTLTVTGESNPEDVWNNFPAGSVINNADIDEGYLSITLKDAVTFTNNATIDLSYTYTISPGWDVNSFQSIEVQAGSTFINHGSVTAGFNVQNNSVVTAQDGSSFAGSMRLGYGSSVGTLTLNGAVTMSSDLEVNNGSLIFAEGSSLDMKGGSITLSETSSIIYQVDGVADESVRANELFRNANIGDDVAITVKGINGSEYKTTLGALTVPEPTTATLSLLALAGLAARRRR